jgi:hypothetical protein
MADKNYCVWCGRSQAEVNRLLPGPVIFICDACVDGMSDFMHARLPAGADKIREEIDHAVQDSFQHMVKNLNLGPLHEKYQRLMRVKFKEEEGSPTFSEVFQEFKKGVEAEIGGSDYQTRYDLAIAYHEMGLAEDAFREMLASLRGALKAKDFERAKEIIAALLYFHGDSARAIRGIFLAMSEAEVVKL